MQRKNLSDFETLEREKNMFSVKENSVFTENSI
jgi:hypothetical protein